MPPQKLSGPPSYILNVWSLNFKQKVSGKTGADNTKDVEITVPLKYLSNFWRTLEMTLVDYEINLILAWSDKCVFSNAAAQTTIFEIPDAKFYVPVVTLSTQDDAKLLQQLKSGFKRTINWNKYLSKVTIQAPCKYLGYLIDPSFQGVNRSFVLSFESNTDRTAHTKYYLPTVEIKDYNVMTDGKFFLISR